MQCKECRDTIQVDHSTTLHCDKHQRMTDATQCKALRYVVNCHCDNHQRITANQGLDYIVNRPLVYRQIAVFLIRTPAQCVVNDHHCGVYRVC